MNYEEKYNEILEWARKNKARLNGVPIEEVLPELAESEDERIRKELINQIEKSRHHPADKARWIAYLEKQKECVSNNFDDVWDEEDCEEIIAEGQKLTPRFKELLKEVCHAWYDRGAKFEKQKEHLRDFMKKMEQKPAEWNDTDMREARQNLISVCRSWERGEQTALLPIVAVRARYFLEHLTEPKPVEWSKEDEDRIRQIERIAQKAECTEKLQEEIHDWLKSLRPQPHWKPSDVCYGIKGEPDPAGVWKPSEEQMEALLSTLHPDDPYYCELRSLYEQLKQL